MVEFARGLCGRGGVQRRKIDCVTLQMVRPAMDLHWENGEEYRTESGDSQNEQVLIILLACWVGGTELSDKKPSSVGMSTFCGGLHVFQAALV